LTFIAVDWGTTSLRAYVCDEYARSHGFTRADAGIQSRQGSFAETLTTVIAALPEVAASPVLMAGMIGSRQGWQEAAYVETPCDVAQISQHLAEVPNDLGRVIKIIPGLCDLSGAAPDVMRGEETQLLGLLQRYGRRFETICLPGTHCKWVHTRGGDILGFKTYMTGELFQILCAHSLLGRLMTDTTEDVWSAFDHGLELADSTGHLLTHLFSARTLPLFERMPAAHLRSYLSGMLIGHEIRAATSATVGPVALLGNRKLAARYQRALSRRKIAHEFFEETIILEGFAVIARAAGFI
jgi:2-dehydro-3-deoxygalactonokinase